MHNNFIVRTRKRRSSSLSTQRTHPTRYFGWDSSGTHSYVSRTSANSQLPSSPSIDSLFHPTLPPDLVPTAVNTIRPSFPIDLHSIPSDSFDLHDQLGRSTQNITRNSSDLILGEEDEIQDVASNYTSDNHELSRLPTRSEEQSEDWRPGSASNSSSSDDKHHPSNGPRIDIIPDIGRSADEITAGDVRRMSEYLAECLLQGSFGCSRHPECEEDRHYNLATTYLPGRLTSYVRSRKLATSSIGLAAESFPTPRNEDRSRFLNARNIRGLMEGARSDDRDIKPICLHSEPRPTGSPIVEIDIDSLLVFPTTLGAFRTFVRLTFTKQTKYNISTNLHIQRRVRYIDNDGREKTESRPLSHIPHLYLGSVDDFYHSSLFMFFPMLINVDRPESTWLTDEHAQQFFDRLLIPACRKNMTDGTWHHVTPSSQVAEGKARAKGSEQQSSTRERGLKQHSTCVCPPAILTPIWEELQKRLRTEPSLRRFRGSFLFLDVKNMKGQFKSSSPFESLSRFADVTEGAFNMDDVDFLVDVGREVTPPQVRAPARETSVFHLSDDEEDDGEEIDGPAECATTYLWKACCLRKTYQDLVAGPFEDGLGRVNFYHNGLLRDAVCMTVEVPVRSWARKGGCIYLQMYNVVKEIEDAQRVFPFQHEGLTDLAIDRSIYRRSTAGRAWEDVARSYFKSKKRVHDGYPAYNNTSFGIRFEARMVRAAFQYLLELVRDHVHPLGRLPSSPGYVWAMATTTWTRFMTGNFEKWTSLVEMAVLTSPTTGIELGVSRLLFALLLCLQNFANSSVKRHVLLRAGSRSHKGTTQYGLNLEANINQYGYGWLARIVDWERFTFREEYARDVIGADQVLGRFYRTGSRLVQSTKDVVDLCYQYLSTSEPRSARAEAVLMALAHFVLRQYRRDVIDKLASLHEVREVWQGEEAKDRIYFCFEGLREALLTTPSLASGQKTACKAPEDLFEWLMGDGPDFNRKMMDGIADGGEQAGWRRMLDQIQRLVRHSDHLRLRWSTRLQAEFRRTMWVVPYPNSQTGSYIQTVSKKGSRLFWSADVNDAGAWYWSKNRPRPGRPTPYPPTLTMSPTELRGYLDSR